MKRTLLRLLLAFICINAAPGLNAAKAACYKDTTVSDTTPVRTDKDGRAYPVLPANPDRLFYLQRSTNINALSYDINIDKSTNKLNEDLPIHVYWLRYAEGHGEPSELSYVQRKFAYGITSKPLGNNQYEIRILSYKKFPLTLMKAADGKYHIFAVVSKKQIQLQSIFIQIEGGAIWSPNVIFVEMKGTDPVTGKEVTERFKP